MSRYIDADFILDGIKNDRALIQERKMDKYKEHYLAFLEKCVELTPSIDIVRCKECYMCDGEMWCSFYDSIMEPDDYCSYGERKGER